MKILNASDPFSIDAFVNDILDEVQRARKKFPSALNLNVALMEEMGEFANAQLTQDASSVYKEGIQVIAVVFRILSEGDKSLDTSPESRQLGTSKS